MSRWWKRAAVFAAWLGLGLTAPAQPTVPQPVGAARMVEPLGYPTPPPPNLVPGPLRPEMTPPVPPEMTSLPSSHTSAFQLENYPPESKWYAMFGAGWLKRYRVEPSVQIFADPNQNLDTGFLSARRLPVVSDGSSYNTPWPWHGRFTLGYLCGNQAFEVTGFYQPSTGRTLATFQEPGRLFVPFTVPGGGTLLGFEGNNGLWTQADRVQTTFESTIGGVEANYRVANSGINLPDLILGFRHLHVRERLGIFTDDEALIVDEFGRSDPLRQATYASQVRTNFLGLQMGGEWSASMLKDKLLLTLIGKAALGVNLIERNRSLYRGDGFQGFDTSTTRVQFGGVGDVQAAIDVPLLEKARLRLGYQALWLVGTTTASSQVELDLTQQDRGTFGYRTLFYHGPLIELHLLF